MSGEGGNGMDGNGMDGGNNGMEGGNNQIQNQLGQMNNMAQLMTSLMGNNQMNFNQSGYYSSSSLHFICNTNFTFYYIFPYN